MSLVNEKEEKLLRWLKSELETIKTYEGYIDSKRQKIEVAKQDIADCEAWIKAHQETIDKAAAEAAKYRACYIRSRLLHRRQRQKSPRFWTSPNGGAQLRS